VWARGGMVASQEAVATQVGVDVLKAGGNAVDAAVAVGFALAVTLPAAGNLGGGGFMIVHDAKSGETVAIDYREKAPARASRDMFLDPAGNADSKLSQYSGLAAGVPGTVAGLALALERHGTMTLPQVMAPAIRLAEEGVVVTPDLSDSLKGSADELKAWPSSTKIFFKDGGAPFEPGDLLKQADLAKSLRQISEGGPDAFYKGDIARLIADEMARDGGLITLEDMAGYQAVVREPVRGTYRDHEVVSMPPPSSGGVHIIQILNILEGFPIGYLGHNSAETIHLMAEAMKLAYADRSEYLGDSDFVDVPVKGLTSKAYAESLRKKISAGRATASATIKPNDPMPYESDQTTHFSVVDKDGNAVANTYTINFSYGAGVVAEGTGILLNNEMDDFSAKPGVPNAYGLIGGDANAVEPGKRPLSSMSPTIVLKDGKPVIVTGSPGGSRIITTVLQVIMNVVDHGMNVAEASAAPRIHHQWLPDELRVEEGISPDTIRLLEAKGHTVRVQPVMGSTHSIMRRDDGSLFGASDPRRPSALTAGY
ncbi:MAG: gamma-glutamyltransferase, partial [Pseudomonadota bacterium]|nr:gamma-glutamyltransferase [Pseudomonadota bacterium]